MKRMLKVLLCSCLLSATAFGTSSAPQQKTANATADELDAEVKQFLAREIAAHVQDIKTLDPPQERVVGALATGEFSWGTFMRALAAVSELTGERTIAGKDVAILIGKMGLIESRRGGKTFAQLYGALALQHFGSDLNKNPLWQSLSPNEKVAWRSLLDPGRFYDRNTRQVINLPDNYFGVASRVAAISFRLGFITDRAYVDGILDQAARQFSGGALFADDAPPIGRYDRYSNEYARYVYDAAETAGRLDIMKALEPALKEQMRVWWDLLSPDGYGYPWGRSLGAISYMDTLEIVAFLAEHPQFRPAPLPQLAGAYYVAWRWLRADFQDDKHLLSVFAFGRGNYAYLSKEREWQQTTAFLGKLAGAQRAFTPAMRKEQITTVSEQLQLPNVARFEFFRQGDRPAGVWMVRRGQMRFALPFTTGPKAGASDYQAAPHSLPGFAVPIEQTYPCLVLYLDLADGSAIVASDGADEIRPSADGQSVTAVWKRWVTPGGKPASFVDPGITTTVTWRLEGDHLRRSETLVASREIHVRRMWTTFPSTSDRVQTNYAGGIRSDSFTSREGSLEFRVVHSDWPLEIQLKATRDSPLGKGSRGPIPLHLVMESRELTLKPGQAASWEFDLHPTAP
jgi:hypothetical protein